MVQLAGSPNLDQAAGLDFFELAHVIPRRFDLGFIFSTQTTATLVFNGFRKQTIVWSDWVNGAGEGVSLLNDPTFPEDVFPLATFAGAIATPMTLEVTPSGPASVDATLGFVFSSGTVNVPITLQRVVAFTFRPENDYEESLEWGTDVMEKKDGSEQRPSFRKNARQGFNFVYFVEDISAEQGTLENFLFDWQANTFGVPIWHEEQPITSAITAGATSIPVATTAYSDFRVNGLVFLIDESTSPITFEVLSIQAVNPTSIDTNSSIANNYPLGTTAMPMMPAVTKGVVRGSRFLNNASTISLPFMVVDNDVDIDSLAAFPSFNSKLLLDSFNFPGGNRSAETFQMQITPFDNEAGLFSQSSQWDRHKRASAWHAIVGTQQALWEHRQMLHAIRGRQTSFYLVRNRDDLVPNANLTSSDDDLFVEHVGYTQYVMQRQPKNVIRVTFNNGDPALLRTIVDSEEISPTQERLEMDSNWPSTYTPAQVDRIEFVEKVRFDSDRITIRHFGGAGHASRIGAPVKAVFD